MEKKIEKEKWLGMQFSKFRELDNCENPAKTLTKRLKNYQQQTKSPYYRFWKILKDCELYMTNFEKFNDIDEGRYSFTEDSDIDAQNTTNDKNKRNICSFSYFEDLEDLNDRQCSETLMWAHYGGSHCGVKIDFRIDPNYEGDIYKIDYNIHDKTYNINLVDNRLSLSTENTDLEIINILTNKKPCFKYECEYRAISSSTKKLPIIIDKITLGRRFTKENVYSQQNEREGFKDEIKNLAKKILEVSRNKKIEIWAYKTRYSKEPKKVEFK